MIENVEVLGDLEENCQIANLPERNLGSTMFQHGTNVILCGGYGNFRDKCFSFGHYKWSYFNSFESYRSYSVGVSMKDALFTFGGNEVPSTSQLLRFNSTIWQKGPKIPDGGVNGGCGVRISDNTLLIIGGYRGMEDLTRILKLNIDTGSWQDMYPFTMHQPRVNHACIVFNGKVIITGGSNPITEIIEMHGNNLTIRYGGRLNDDRFGHGMGIVNYSGVPTLITFGGGLTVDSTEAESVEIWNDQDETWKVSTDIKMEISRKLFGYATIPRELLCP